MKHDIGDVVYVTDREKKEVLTGKIHCVDYTHSKKDGYKKEYSVDVDGKIYSRLEDDIFTNNDLAFADAHGI